MSEKILLVDFDGVIHSYKSVWKGPSTIPDRPVDGAFDFLRKAIELFDVQIYSARSSHPGGIAAMVEWFVRHGAADIVAEVSFPTQKPPAFLTIDDRAIQFNGNWSSYDINEFYNFKPWNKR